MTSPPAGPAQPSSTGPEHWVLTGPTASGKSALALELAERLSLEILSMDSMAVYRRMDIGTAKPPAEDRQRVPHQLIDLVEPAETFDTARWCEHAAQQLRRLPSEASRRRALFVGGTPLYLMAFFKGLMEGPAANPVLRQQLEERLGSLLCSTLKLSNDYRSCTTCCS